MRVRLVLGVLAAAVVGVGTLDLVQHYRVGAAAAVGLSLLRAAPLGLVLRRPWPAWAGTLAAVLLTAAVADPVSGSEPWPWTVTSVLSALPVLVVLGTRRPRPELAAAWASVLAAGAVPVLLAPGRGALSQLPVVAVLAAAALASGDLARGRTEATRRLREQVAATDTERAGREALAERARLARELHDVIAHGLSEVTVRADSAPHRLPGVSPAAAAEFAAIGEAARGALVELRQVLGVLRDPDGGAPTAPLPGLAELPALVGDTPLTLSARPDGVPPVVQLTAFRVVQEALSNVRRHAPGAAASVSVTQDTGALRVEVTNPAGTVAGTAAGPASGTAAGPASGTALDVPPGTAAATTPGAGVGGAPGAGSARGAGAGTSRGYGLAGMRERVELLRGTLSAGPRPDGGWQVQAVLPIGQEDR